MSDASLASHACLRAMPVALDWTADPPATTRQAAYEWAAEALLPRTSSETVMNLNKYRVATDPPEFLVDPQSNATLTSADYAVSQKAFVLDLESHLTNLTWDDSMLDRVFDHYEPLFGAYGWNVDETPWTKVVSLAGGMVMCSFASPDLSFWASFPLPDGRSRPLPLPHHDRNMSLDRSKTYVIWQTNEGDTPRIVDSLMSSSWASDDRGSMPVAWSVDAVLAERFPFLFDHVSSTASANDSFVGGVAGAGYVYVSRRARESFFAAALVPRTIRVSGAASPRVRKTLSLGRGVAATHAAGGPDVA